MPWVLRFLAAGRSERLDPVADGLFRLSRGSVAAYKKRLAGTGQEQLVRDSMYVHVYRNPKAASLDHLGWQLRQARQVPIELIDKHALQEIEPHIADDFEAAILIKQQGRASDPAGIGIALAEKALAKGANHIQTKVHEIHPDQGSGCQLVTDQGVFTPKKSCWQQAFGHVSCWHDLALSCRWRPSVAIIWCYAIRALRSIIRLWMPTKNMLPA